MSYSVTEPSRDAKSGLAGVLVAVYALITLLPLLWIISTGFKSPADAIAYPPKMFSEPTLEGYVNLFTTQTRQTLWNRVLDPPETWYEQIVLRQGHGDRRSLALH